MAEEVLNPPTIDVPTEVKKTNPNEGALNLINNALSQVSEVLTKAEETHQMLQQKMSDVTAQRIALNAQKSLLTELRDKLVPPAPMPIKVNVVNTNNNNESKSDNSKNESSR